MLQKRIIPVLLLRGDSLFKTINFKNPKYIGDAVNTVRIFNDLEADELVILDIDASKKNKPPNFNLLKQIANECFMPLSYGGGINNLYSAKKIIEIGFEKIIINTANFTVPNLIGQLSNEMGSQSIVGVIDAKKSFFGGYNIFSNGINDKHRISPEDWAKELVRRGVGELIVTSINQEGTWNGFDLHLIQRISKAVNVPIICHGGCGSEKDIEKVFEIEISAVGLGSMLVFQKKGMGVLIDIPKL